MERNALHFFTTITHRFFFLRGWKPSASNEVCLKPEAEELLLASYEVLQNCLTDMKNVKHEKSKC
jgi:hypothetical protein